MMCSHVRFCDVSYCFRVRGVDYSRDTVIVHQFLKGTYAPSLGHFVVKLETYLRIAKIPYEVGTHQSMSVTQMLGLHLVTQVRRMSPHNENTLM